MSMGKFDRCLRLPTEEEERRARFATKSIVRYGPKKRKAEPARSSGGADNSLSGSSSEQGNGIRNLSDHDLPHEMGHRFRLEYTFVQGTENKMETAIELLNAARRMPAAFESRASAITKAAFLANQIKRQLGTTDAQLQAVLVGAGARVQENGSWRGFKSGFLSPTRVLKVLSTGHSLSDATAQSISFAFGPWAGCVYSVAEIFHLVGGKNWALLMTPVFVGFLELTNELIEKVDSGDLPGPELKIAELQLAHVISDYWGLNTLLTFHDYTDNMPEVLVPFLPEDVKLESSAFLTMAGKMNLTSEQLDQCMLLKRYAQSYSAELATSEEFIQDIMDTYVEQQASNHINPDILEAVEAVRQNSLSKRALEVEVVHKLLFAILEPIQTAKFLTWIRKTVERPICQWKEWMRLIYPCILGADSWMNRYIPPGQHSILYVPDIAPPIIGLG